MDSQDNIRIPPFSKEEILQFYTDGVLPERFRNENISRTERILKGHGMKDSRTSINDMIFNKTGGLF